MPIKKLKITGFRCLNPITIDFDAVTLIVGENDCGKSSLIDCLKIFTQEYLIDNRDFSDGKKAIELELHTDKCIYYHSHRINDENAYIIERKMKPTVEFREFILSFLKNPSNPNPTEFDLAIRSYAKMFKIPVRADSKSDTLKSKLLELLDNGQPEIKDPDPPNLNKIQFGGRQFEDPDAFFRELFLKDKQSELWNTRHMDNGKTIKEIIEEELETYSKTISDNLEKNGIKEKMRQHITNLTDIKVDPIFEPKNLTITARVSLVEGDSEVPIQKKGDGTKRRVSLALLDYKAEEEQNIPNESKLYVLDEPDTHLHVKAQLELFRILKELSAKGSQIILTSHSPFLINVSNPRHIRVLYRSTNSRFASIRSLKDQPEASSEILKRLGVENTLLFFARKIILVEGDSEEAFLPRAYRTLFGTPMNAHLIKIININGIHNAPGFAKALNELVDPKLVYIIKDTEPKLKLTEVVENLEIPKENQFELGEKEFEDEFSDTTLYLTWKNHLEICGKPLGEKTLWTEQNISAVRQQCRENPQMKFSKELFRLNSGTGVSLDKITLAKELGEQCTKENLPPKIKEILRILGST